MRLAKLPGDTLHEIADLLFGATPYTQSAYRRSSRTLNRNGARRPGHTFVALVPERERWRTFHQFSILWVLLAVLWVSVADASAWLPIATASSALVSRGIAAWLQHRRERRAVRA